MLRTGLTLFRKTNSNSFQRTLSSSSNTPISALDVFTNSCYHRIDFKINENNTVQDAVNRFSTFNIGCLAVTNDENKLVGVCSERDYITKVAALKKKSDEVKIKDICTYKPYTIMAKKTDSLNVCMNKMIYKDIRHLLVVDENDKEFIGMISIRDLIKEINARNNDIINRLTDFNMGKGAYFSSE